MNLTIPKKTKKVMKSFYMSEDSANFVVKYAESQDCSASEFVDELLQEFKRKHKK